MRGLLPGLLLIAACYSPSVRSDVPCSASGACPEGESCIAGFCFAPGAVPPDVAVTIADRDHDGVADDRDNCPDTANTDQANEDGDKLGDACDSCPQIADDTGADGDGDHIGDACDPNPGAHDTVWLYNGFGAGLPAWSRSDHWTASGGNLVTAAVGNTANDGEYLVAPFTPTGAIDNFTATTTVTVQAMTGTNGDHSAGVEIWDQTAMKAVDCGIDQNPAGSNSVLYLSDDFNNLNKQTPFSWAINTQYRILLARHGASYTCNVVGPSGAASLTGNSNVVPRDGNTVDIWAYGATAQFGSVEVIGTP